jgi:hypothetical protein
MEEALQQVVKHGSVYRVTHLAHYLAVARATSAYLASEHQGPHPPICGERPERVFEGGRLVMFDEEVAGQAKA